MRKAELHPLADRLPALKVMSYGHGLCLQHCAKEPIAGGAGAAIEVRAHPHSPLAPAAVPKSAVGAPSLF